LTISAIAHKITGALYTKRGNSEMHKMNRLLLVSLMVMAALGLMLLNVRAGDVVLSNNSGTGNSEWFITGEASLVMNGFNLSNFGVAAPASIDKVSIAVTNPTPGQLVDIVIYQDANGGSPVDATLVGRGQADITQAGVFTFTFATPIVVTQPVVWVGFYLPVDFEFQGDTSGTSVLTYWAWTGASRFDLASLGSAQVLGPADGTAPVNINMNGVARITAEISGATAEQAAVTGAVVVQVPGTTNTNLVPPLAQYDFCSPVFVDLDDVAITLQERTKFYCSVVYEGFAPPSPTNYDRRGHLYDIFVFGDAISSTRLRAEVTHCIKPEPQDLATAVLGVAFGSPRTWHLLPSQRYGDLICAEVGEVGFLSYFVPVASPTPTPTA
jgi:hypothetical protein